MQSVRRTGALPALLTVAEVAAALRVDASTVYRAVERGDLEHVRLTHAGAIRIPARELERVLTTTKGAA